VASAFTFDFAGIIEAGEEALEIGLNMMDVVYSLRVKNKILIKSFYSSIL
jgi:hypothetical protein